METSDDAAPGVAPLGGLIVGAENGIAGTAGGAEQRGLGQGEQAKVAAGGQFGRGVLAQALVQARGKAGIIARDRFGLEAHG